MRRHRPAPATPPPPKPAYIGPYAEENDQADQAVEEDLGRRARRARVVLPIFLAGAAVITAGAAAYSRSALSDDAPAARAAVARAIEPSEEALGLRSDLRRSDETERARAVDATLAGVRARTAATPGPTPGAVSGSLQKDAAGNYPGVQIEVGRLNVTRDPTGILQTSLPLRVTNIGYVPRSFDIRVTARDPKGAKITDDTGTVLNLRAGQSAEVRVLDIVNNRIAEDLQRASFDITDVFAY